METARRIPRIGASLVVASVVLGTACRSPESGRPDPGRSADIPLSDAVERDYLWRTRDRAPQPDRAIVPVASEPRARSVQELVRTATISGVSWQDESYDEVFKLVRTVTDVPIIVTPGAREVIDGEGLTLTVNLIAPLRVHNLLDLMVGKSDDLRWIVKYGVVQITTKQEASGGNVLATYDVRDLIFPRTEFLPPVIRGIPTGEDSETPRTGGEGEDKVSFVEPDTLIANIKLATDPDYWDAEGGGTIDFADGGYLIVVASPEMHRRLGGFLR